jgi:hypothetical protein
MNVYKRFLKNHCQWSEYYKDSESEKPMFSCSHPSNADHETRNQNDP